jgi:hypothetical protein
MPVNISNPIFDDEYISIIYLYTPAFFTNGGQICRSECICYILIRSGHKKIVIPLSGMTILFSNY